MVSFAYAAVTIDTSAAEAALNRVDSERMMMETSMKLALQKSLNSMGLTNKQIDRVFERIFAFEKTWLQEKERVLGDVERTEGKVKGRIMNWRHMTTMLVHQVWNIIENTTAVGKTMAGRTIGFAISAISQVISMGYSAAATMSTMGPAGAAFAALQIGSTLVSVQAQANAIAQQQALEHNNNVVGDIAGGIDY